MAEPASPATKVPGFSKSLSARLLILTVFFVMVAEVLIYAPSIARFRMDYLQDTISRAYLSMIAVEAVSESQLLMDLQTELLYQTDTYSISVKRDDQRMLMVGHDMPPDVDLAVDLREPGFIGPIMAAFDTLFQNENRVLSVAGLAPKSHSVMVEVIVDETPMRRAMVDFSTRILNLSLIISFFTAGLVFLSLRWMMIRPLQRITRHIARFRESPESPVSAVANAGRQDEIGVAERELLLMQNELHASLRQKTRLATLGAAMAKINHDLRNTLATAVLASDALAAIKDPEVQRVTPRLMKAVDRAVRLCSQTLNFAREVEPPFCPQTIVLRGLTDEVFQSVLHPNFDPFDDLAFEADGPSFDAVNDIAAGFTVTGDKDQLFRGLHNLIENAVQVGATQVAVSAHVADGVVHILVSDNGPGLNEKAIKNMFQPFAGSSRDGGTGLGLVIVRDIAQAHRGHIHVAKTGPDGTIFDLGLPAKG